MKILVYDVAAEDGGGLFILKQFYNDVLLRNDDNQWFFLVSNDSIKSKGNIIVKEYDYVKKSYLHRWLFESIKLKTILKKIKPDLVISLQNMPIKRFNGKQFIYLHQSLQFCPKRFSLFKSEERGLAFRQKIICNIYKKNLSKADHIFVQTNWIKDSTKKWLKIHGDKITIVPISVNMINDIKRKYEGQTSRVFFYPARAEKYKNPRGISFRKYSAVKPNEKKINSQYERFWYMLPQFAPRHFPNLFPKTNNLNMNYFIVIDIHHNNIATRQSQRCTPCASYSPILFRQWKRT